MKEDFHQWGDSFIHPYG